MKINLVFVIFALLLLSYLLLPGPTSIEDFPTLPNSSKSTLEGDTIQLPNVVAYFSNNYRDFATQLYYQGYKNQHLIPFPPLRLNYPPEFAYIAIKDQTHSTYLEEMVYPLRGSLFVNGLEPFDRNGQPRYEGAVKFDNEGVINNTKVTLRFYPAPVWARLTVWLGIILSIALIWKLGRKIINV